MKNNARNIALIILFSILCFSVRVSAQTPVRTGPASAEEIKSAQAVLEANLDSLKAHKKYIYAMGLENPALLTQYDSWIKKYPQNVNIPLAIGTVFYNADMAQAKEFLLKAAALQPKNGNIWFMLSGDAFMRGQNDLSTEYKKKATEADPANAGYAYAYLSSFQEGDTAIYKQKVFDFVKRFPADELGAAALYWLAEDAMSPSDKIVYFEKLRTLYPPQKFNWSAAGMVGLADAYLQTDLEKAIVLINQMGDGKDWKLRRELAEALVKINNLEQAGNYKDAITILNAQRLPRFNYIADFILLKKAGLLGQSGNTKAAYDTLAVRFAKLPDDELYTAMLGYGKELGKDKSAIDKEIETIRVGTAVAAYPFELGMYTSEAKLSLADLKGKVVLLTFWFPGCEYCLEEFPHFQAVIDQFKKEDVAYVGINVFPTQDGYVLPFLKNNKYSFIPLRGTNAFAAKNYDVHGEPENFLIDKDGRIIFSDFRIDSSNHRTLELMIDALLNKG